MAAVIVTPAAQKEFEALPRTIQIRVLGIFRELKNWPNVSGCKPLRGVAGNRRKRTGDYRIIFHVEGDHPAERVVVWKIGHRDGFYD